MSDKHEQEPYNRGRQYVESQRAKGKTDEVIRRSLEIAGWSASAIEQLWATVAPLCTAETPAIRTQQQNMAQESLSACLQAKAADSIPAGWASFRSPGTLFEICYPSDWSVQTGERLSLRPKFAREVWETTSHCLWSPGMTVIVRAAPQVTMSNEEVFQALADDLAVMFEDYHLCVRSQESAEFRGCPAAFFRFRFERAEQTWETWLLWQLSGKYLYWVDAVGSPADMSEHAQLLKQVMATFRVFER